MVLAGVSRVYYTDMIRVWVKSRYAKRDPGKCKRRLKPAVPWWFNFDSYPFASYVKLAEGIIAPTSLDSAEKLSWNYVFGMLFSQVPW